MRERVLEVSKATDELRSWLGRSPTAEEIAESIGVTVVGVAEVAEAASAYDAASLDEATKEDGALSPNARVAAIGFEDERFDLVEYGATSSPRSMRFRSGTSDPSAALRAGHDPERDRPERCGMSQMHVSRLLRRGARAAARRRARAQRRLSIG